MSVCICLYLRRLYVGGVLNKYHGFGGGVKGISCFSNDEDTFFAACGLDRYLRVYSMEPPRVVYKVREMVTANITLFCFLW